MVLAVCPAAEAAGAKAKNAAVSMEAQSAAVDDAGFDYNLIAAKVAEIEKAVKASTFTRQSLDEASGFLMQTEMALDAAVREIDKNSKYAQEALNALGEEPAENEGEEASIKAMREKYTQAMSGYKNKLIEANLLKTEISRLNAMISEARSRILIGNLVAEQNVLVSPQNFLTAIRDAAAFYWEMAASPVAWYRGLDEKERDALGQKLWYVLLILGLSLSVGLFIRSFIIRKWGYRHTDELPRYGQKIAVAVITAIAYGVIPSLLIGGCLLWQMSNTALTESKFGVVLANVLYYSLYITLVRALVRVTLAPWNGRWRLFNITDERAERVFRAARLCIILLGAAACQMNIAKYYEVSEQLVLLLEVAEDAVKAFAIVLLTQRVFGELPTKKETEGEAEQTAAETVVVDAEAEKAEKTDDEDEDEGLSFSFKVEMFMGLFAFATFGISLFGYPRLATFIFNRFMISVLVFGAFVIIKKFIFDFFRRSIVFLFSTFKMRKKLLSKADFWLTLLVTPVLAMLFIYSLLRLWGVSGNFMLQGIKKLVFGFKAGGMQISLIAIVMGLAVFMASILVVKILKRRLSNNLLTRINMDEGIKHSLISGFGFIGFIISGILGIVAMGVDLSNLAVIAGALSVGIGFGLQDVIKNLVSGIIILFERPFKVGDWVILAGEEGKIKQINIRSTELETWTKRSVIIPNATLISSSLVNLTHGNNWQRQSVEVGVSYDSDAELVTKLLLECAKGCKKVMKVPAPYVIFKDFGASSLDFELRFYVSDIWNGWAANSDIRYEILRRFREEGINIAYPQIVVHQGSMDTSVKGWQTNV